MENYPIITEKLYRILQIYLSNKGQASIELVNLISSDNISVNFLQALSTKISIDQQARLVHRDTGKIILPYEHWTNACFLKHCSGPGGIHLNLDATIKSIFESYSCGKENFGFDRDFILDVVNQCPSNSCRFTNSFKTPPFEQQQQQQHHQNFAQPTNPVNVSMNEYGISPTRSPLLMQPPVDPTKMNRPLTNQQITQQILQQQQNHRINHQSSIESLEKQRVLQQLDKKHYETVAAIIQANNQALPNQMSPAPNVMMQVHKTPNLDYSRRPSYDGIETYSAGSYSSSNRELLQNNWITPSAQQPVNFDFDRDGMVPGQEKIVRAFTELMKNMARMKAFIRPSMVKPYGKQSESLQKTLMDTIQLVQTLRNFLPKPHISINNWKNVDQTEATI